MHPDSTTVRELLLAKFEALLDECDLVADNAKPGQTLDDMDEFFLIKGRALLQETFQIKLQERIERAEAATKPPHCPKCKKKRPAKIRKQKRSPPHTESLPSAVAIIPVPHVKPTPFPST